MLPSEDGFWGGGGWLQIGGAGAGPPPCSSRRPRIRHLLPLHPQVSTPRPPTTSVDLDLLYLILSCCHAYFSKRLHIGQRSHTSPSSTGGLFKQRIHMFEFNINFIYQISIKRRSEMIEISIFHLYGNFMLP